MKKKLIGLFASVALMGSGVAFAHDQSQMGGKKDAQHQQQGGTGGAGSTSSGSQAGQTGQTGQMGQSGMTNQVSGNQLTGRVVKSDRKTVWIEHAGAIVPLKIDKNTQFTDPSLKRAQDLREGDEIRASYEVRKTDNVATSIEKSQGTGGSGTEVMSPDSSINQSPGTLPSNDGTGGSGLDPNSPDINKGSSPELGPDSNPNPNHTSGDY
jgi:hypothetical protein